MQIQTVVSFSVRYFCHPNSRDFLVWRNIPAWLQELSIYLLFHQVIPAHLSAITAVQFSKDSKLLATYSYEEAKINFWQVYLYLLYKHECYIEILATEKNRI
jgi:WD40 repeat protein